MNLNTFLLVGTGGAFGSVLRYAASLLPINKTFPYSTFVVNILGSFFIGLLLGLFLKNNITDSGWKFLATGFCGGFTTFSALSLEGFDMLQQQRYFMFAVYFLLSISIGVSATYFGFILTK